MGEIREELILADRFSAEFAKFLSYGERSVSQMASLETTIQRVGDDSATVLVRKMNETNEILKEIAGNTNMAKSAQDSLGDSAKRTDDISKHLLSTISRIVAAFGGIKLATGLIDLSDTMAMTQSRLSLMINEVDNGMRDVQELQDAIYQSAGRSRGAYQDTADAISKLGLMAGDAFSSSDEVIAFIEQVNKQFKIAGTEASGIQAAMLQLTQAMGSGVLRGEEYNSILEQAPNIIQTIADYMEVPKGQLKDMAAEGKITADIVKAAMFAAADDTNAKFESIPMTYEDAWTMVANASVNAFREVSQELNDFLNSAAGDRTIQGLVSGMEVLSVIASGAITLMAEGASWVTENWDYVYPVLIGIGAGFAAAGAAGMASGLSTALAWAAANAPFIAIGVTIGTLIFLLRQSGVTWQEMGEVAGSVIGGLYTVFYTTVSTSWNLFATFAEYFANVFNDPVAAIANLFAQLLDTILSVVQTAASAIDALLGSNISGAVAGFRNDINDWVKSKYGENQIQIKRMSGADFGENIAKGKTLGGDIGKKLDDLNLNMSDFTKSFGNGIDLSGMAGGIGDIGKVGSVGSVKNVEGDIRLADEDLKMYRDLAERRYMNQIELKTMAPSIHVTLPAGASGNLSADDVADHIKKMLIEQMSSQTAISHG